MRRDDRVYIFIPTRNCSAQLKDTVDSLLRQTVTTAGIRIVFMDNASTDGTYEKELSYITMQPQLFSVFRENVPTTEGRILKKAMTALRFSEIGFSLLITPGDILYEDCLECEMQLLIQNDNVGFVVAEVDLRDGEDKPVLQEPLYAENCELMLKYNKTAYFSTGIGHKIQLLFRGKFLPTGETLPSYAQLSQFNDWVSVSALQQDPFLYIREKKSCIYIKETEDPIGRLTDVTFWMKRMFYSVEIGSVPINKEEDFLPGEREESYRGMAILALQYSSEQIKKQRPDLARKCLLYAEIMYLNIVNEEVYKTAKQAIDDMEKMRKL
ncbi:MAG: glycosyltransferase family A protein [Lachnospiraceae bacterium]